MCLCICERKIDDYDNGKEKENDFCITNEDDWMIDYKANKANSEHPFGLCSICLLHAACELAFFPQFTKDKWEKMANKSLT